MGDSFDVQGYSLFSITAIKITTKENTVKSLHGCILRNVFRDKPFQINDLKRKYRSDRLEVQVIGAPEGPGAGSPDRPGGGSLPAPPVEVTA